MNKFLIILISLSMSLGLMARENLNAGFGLPQYSVSFLPEYSYNLTYGSFANFNMQALMPVNQHFEMQANLQFSTVNKHSAGLVLRPKFELPVGELFAETHLFYCGNIRARQHDLDMAIAVGYRFDYLSLTFGNFTRIMEGFDRVDKSAEARNCEPFNFLYRIQIFCRPQTCPWNLYFVFSDYDDYQYERMWEPIFQLGGQYDIDQHWRVLLNAECKPTGMFHLNAAFYSATVRAGFTYSF